MRALLVRIETDLGLVGAWGEVDDATLKAKGATAYGGKGKRWQFFVVGENKSPVRMATAVRLPPTGPGVPSNDPSIVNLPPELATKAWMTARKALGVNS